ncbi:MAG: BatA domain-containing protein, partial [Pirellula sp.]
MSFLAPLYGLAALAVALPILLHLVRKRPKETQAFSSLMFLEPSPPRLTRHSRIEQWLLLFLRVLAIALLAIAFARPYWNAAAETAKNPSGLRRLILLDSSASMRREGLWELAKARAEKILSQSNPTDILSVYTFDRSIKPLVSVEESEATASGQRLQLALTGLRSASPTWHTTDLGTALVNAADLLQADTDSNSDAASESSEIVVVTDFQNGMQLDKLAGYSWPTTCKVRIERIEPALASNARAFILNPSQADESASDLKSTSDLQSKDDHGIRVRVVNQSNSTKEQFLLSWIDDNGLEVPGSQTKCQVPAGNSLVVRMPLAAPNVESIQLAGDQSDFDNKFFVAKRELAKLTLPCIDVSSQSPEDSLSFFLEQLPLSGPTRTVAYEHRLPGSDDAWPEPSQAPLIVASHHAIAADLFG